MGTKDGGSPGKGRGGAFDTRKNPFGATRQARGVAPEYASQIRLGLAVDMLIRAGCAIMLGRTRDGGALVITVLDGDDRHRTYCVTEEELNDAIRALEEMYGG
jgi:hypothetical protein